MLQGVGLILVYALLVVTLPKGKKVLQFSTRAHLNWRFLEWEEYFIVRSGCQTIFIFVQ
jgi:hypothetical protein